MPFGKLGRPPEDRLLRQREIYQAISPLIREQGVRTLSMREAANVACLSIGGLYHYFPTKRDLVLHGIQDETLHRFCDDFHQQFTHLVHVNPQQYFDAFYMHLVESALFMRPSVYAATELRIDIFTIVSKSVEFVVAEFVESLRLLDSTLPEERLKTLAGAIRSFFLAALVDTSSTNEELQNEFYLLIGGYLSFDRSSPKALAVDDKAAS
jgi:AcrR family transcriptional regulator